MSQFGISILFLERFHHSKSIATGYQKSSNENPYRVREFNKNIYVLDFNANQSKNQIKHAPCGSNLGETRTELVQD